jgi:dienelactone hydrolase
MTPARTFVATSILQVLLGTSGAFADVYTAESLFVSTFDDGFLAQVQNVRIEMADGLDLPGRLYGPAEPNGAAVVMMHGCSGQWSQGEPWTVAQGAIEKWGTKLAQSGYFALAIDSYTSRTPAGVALHDFQQQCAGDVHEGAVDPYTTRVGDMDSGIAWLRYHLGATATARIGALGWSQGAQSVLVRSAETYAHANVSRFDEPTDEVTAQLASVVFYPGCGTSLGFVEGSGVGSSYWRPHRDVRLNHGGADPLHASCADRADIAIGTYDSVPGSGHAVAYVEYPNAHHSFDGAITEWPATRCDPDAAPPDFCAASDADISSLEFLSGRLLQQSTP